MSIYLDHNATTPVDPEVLESMLPFLRQDFGNPSSAHARGRRAHAAVERAREEVAALIGARATEIVFTGSGTESSALAILGAAEARRRAEPGRRPLRLLSFALEHPATLRPIEMLAAAAGDEVTLLPVGPDGRVDPQALRRAIERDPPFDLVSLMHAHNETGVVQPVEEVGSRLRGRATVFHVDAAQTAGKLPIDVDRLGCHLLSIAGHKLYAPKGVGALYIRSGLALAPVIPGAGQERGLRGGTLNVPGIVGLGAACRIARERLAAGEADRLAALRDRMWVGLSAGIPGIARTCADAPTLPNTLHVRFPGVRADDVLGRAPGIEASTGSACHSGDPEPPAAILALGVPPEEARGSVRLSLGHGTTSADVDAAVRELIAAWRAVRGESP